MAKKIEKRLLSELMARYQTRKKDIEKRLAEFENVKDGADSDIYAEMAFCMLTPQSKARQCWAAVEELKEKNLLLSSNIDIVKDVLRKKVRFHNNKAGYIVDNKKVFMSNGKLEIKSAISQFDNVNDLRLWLIKNIRGYGWKEASHFLRNIGMGEDIAILDRHIIKNLYRYGIINEMPKSLTAKKYEEIEEKMRRFCQGHDIPMSHLDLLFWSEETGAIFK